MNNKYFDNNKEQTNKSDFINRLDYLIDTLIEIKTDIANDNFNSAKITFENDLSIDFLFHTFEGNEPCE